MNSGEIHRLYISSSNGRIISSCLTPGTDCRYSASASNIKAMETCYSLG